MVPIEQVRRAGDPHHDGEVGNVDVGGGLFRVGTTPGRWARDNGRDWRRWAISPRSGAPRVGPVRVDFRPARSMGTSQRQPSVELSLERRACCNRSAPRFCLPPEGGGPTRERQGLLATGGDRGSLPRGRRLTGGRVVALLKQTRQTSYEGPWWVAASATLILFDQLLLDQSRADKYARRPTRPKGGGEGRC